MAENISTINLAGEDYNTLTLWEADVNGDLVTATTQETAECYNDDGDLNDRLVIDGSTTDSDNYMKVTVPSADRHNGTEGTGFCLDAGGTTAHGIYVRDLYTVIEWVEVKNFGVNNGYRGIYVAFASVTSANCTVSHCIVHDSGGTADDGIYLYRTYDCYIYNCIAYSVGRGFTATEAGAGNPCYFYNCTAYNNSDSGFAKYNSEIRCINCVSLVGTPDFEDAGSNGVVYCDNCCSDDGTADDFTGSNNLVDKVAADNFVDTGSPPDLHVLDTDADIYNTGDGTTPKTIFTDDIDGDTRPGADADWDIGADEYVAAGGTDTADLVCQVTVTNVPATTNLVSQITVLKPATADLICKITTLKPSTADLVSRLTVFKTVFDVDVDNTLLTSLEAYWKLNETSGTRVDSFKTYDLTDNNTVGYALAKRGNGADFEQDTQEYLSSTDSGLDLGDFDFTYAGWGRIESKAADRRLLTKWDTNHTSLAMQLYYDLTADRFRFEVQASGGTTNVDADQLGSPSLDTWYFIQVWHDASGNGIGIRIDNGTADTAAHSAGVRTGSGSFYLGVYNPTGSVGFWDGLEDEWGYWKKLLSAQEESDLYNNGNGNTLGNFAQDSLVSRLNVLKPTSLNLVSRVTTLKVSETNLVSRLTTLKSGEVSLVSKITVLKPSSTNLVSTILISVSTETNLVSKLVVRRETSTNLVSRLTVSPESSKLLTSKITVLNVGSTNLVSRIFVGESTFINLVCRITIPVPISASLDLLCKIIVRDMDWKHTCSITTSWTKDDAEVDSWTEDNAQEDSWTKIEPSTIGTTPCS